MGDKDFGGFSFRTTKERYYFVKELSEGKPRGWITKYFESLIDANMRLTKSKSVLQFEECNTKINAKIKQQKKLQEEIVVLEATKEQITKDNQKLRTQEKKKQDKLATKFADSLKKSGGVE